MSKFIFEGMGKLLAEFDIALRHPEGYGHVLKAYHHKNQLWVWCSHEKRWHHHGNNGDSRFIGNAGHRIAHCRDPLSPYKNEGYFLNVIGKMDSALLKIREEFFGRGSTL